jgi:hypothetical protein
LHSLLRGKLEINTEGRGQIDGLSQLRCFLAANRGVEGRQQEQNQDKIWGAEANTPSTITRINLFGPEFPMGWTDGEA